MNQTIIIILIATAISFGLTVLALMDSLRKDFETPGQKMLWHVIAMVPFIGSLLYFLIGARKGKPMK